MTMHFDELEAALSRRGLLVRGLVAGAALFTVRGAFADELSPVEVPALPSSYCE